MDIQRYLQRLQLDISPRNDFATLLELHRAQAFNIPFENFNVRLKHPIPLDEQSLFEKLILNNRGGYCYELNILFSFLLKEMGFEVTLLIGRPLYGYNNAIRPKTHMVLKVKTEGKDYLCDLGFGGYGLIEPMELTYQQESEQFGDTFKLVPHAEGYELKVKLVEKWISLYSFDLTSQEYIDYELANFFNMHSHDSRFTQQVICAMPTPNGRILLLDKKFKTNGTNNAVPSHELYDQILLENFGITQPLSHKLFDD